MKFIVKFFPEITIKSNPVRRRFIKQLRTNLRTLLSRVAESIHVESCWDHIEIDIPAAESEKFVKQVQDLLSNTPGISSFVQVKKYPLGDMDSILEHTLASYGDKLQGKSFAVRCRRSGRHAFKSIDVERYVGGGLNQRLETGGVNLGKPDVTVALEIKQDDLFIVEDSFPGLGGFPLGSQEAVLSLISGGFDSCVSSYLAIKRGLKTHYCFFNLGGRAHEIAVKEVALYLWMKYGASQSVKFVTVPFEAIVEEILSKVENSQMGVVLKRMMLRAAAKVAAEMNIQALVTGESVAQVSSQTLPNLAVIDEVCPTLVLRPLIMSDKQDIIDVARKIGTEEFSAAIPEYCGVISVKPTTRARPEKIEREESKFDFSLLERALENRQTRHIDNIKLDLEQQSAEVSIHSDVPPDSVVLDIRHPDEEELKPLELAGVRVERLPFYKLNSGFPKLDQSGHYLLYCEKGIMSQLHASYLLEEGYTNVAVFRPGAGS